MEVTVRQARKEDAEQILEVYKEFIKQFVGSAFRTTKPFSRMLRRKDSVNWVALNDQNRVIGYVHARIEKRTNQGEFRDIIIHPKHDFQEVAQPLVEKVNATFVAKRVSSIVAASIRNPAYEKLFLKLGFFESESNDVFMFAILNVQKFLSELSPLFINRLKPLEYWNGVAQIECEKHSLFLQKTSEKVQSIVWTNQPVDLRVILTRELLTKLVFGLADPVESHRTGQLKVETTKSSEKANQLLKALFPQRQFLIMDYW